ncbi:MAG TPA: rod shape-determining protein RodA [Patescibacteria group bacterium]|nr:rod shape-determining protein RodA [Patescibacteria group bacterium]
MPWLTKLYSKSIDWWLLLSVLLLVALGLAGIYSVDLSRGGELVYFKKQLLAAGIGIVLLVVAGLRQYSFFRYTAKLWYLFALILLVAVLFFGRTIRGTTGWFSVAGFSFQPVELAKVGLILMLGYVIANFGRRFERSLFFYGTLVMTFVLIALIMLQPDLGSAVMLGMIWFGIMLLVGARRWHILSLVGGVLTFGILAWFFLLQPYQKERLLTFMDPGRDPLSAGYNVNQSIIAVGAGQFFGRGLGFGSQSQLRFLPEAQTDFIFSVIGEELGFVGVLVLLGLYGVIIWRLVKIVRETADDFVAVVVSGIVILFFTQFFVNIGANIGILPVTGVTLPFVSYGGSSLMINLLLVGIAESMVIRKY